MNDDTNFNATKTVTIVITVVIIIIIIIIEIMVIIILIMIIIITIVIKIKYKSYHNPAIEKWGEFDEPRAQQYKPPGWSTPHKIYTDLKFWHINLHGTLMVTICDETISKREIFYLN